MTNDILKGVVAYLNKNKTHELEVFQDFYRYMQPKMESFIFNDLDGKIACYFSSSPITKRHELVL